ncbi:precorrin-6y C5,15-methyltransferase (decarboxylating) subunit CbiE [Aliishimia ponticola]|uniref:Precorrin-6y C5,15-methyltransferase (Decarboxylating) subunit CbiE n=1 Tax=Aliishimia ponticola TaxID=2499833 RepID=A0A4S4NF55_9RHOB|nr:precorrin-6y C5,15-methyltransferase (decarboxylating) subunit CbiE [Aliishimia ponticola]THH38192.1 precorrin-6y C5,15-methyltransferase (decarboxylating) subunit CbiE [Aliishimia ponticola]
MADLPWLTIIGLGEDGPEGLTSASLAALNGAEIVMGPDRHLALLPDTGAERVTWPVPFADGIEKLLSYRGRKVAVLASGDPFWFGAGSVLVRHLSPGEWRAFPGVSCFSLAAARLGWALDKTTCLGLHATPLSHLRPDLAPGTRLIVTLRDGEGPAALAAYLTGEGFGDSQLHVLQSLAGPAEQITTHTASALTPQTAFTHPVCVAVEVQGQGACLSQASGLSDDWFDHDGQITKRPVRALTLSALAPRAGEHLWDIGGGSGSIAIEWLLTHPATQATVIEAVPERAARIAKNAARLGAARLKVVTGTAPDALEGLAPPDAVFIGGGLSAALLARLGDVAQGARIVANAVTLESEALLTQTHADRGGNLHRIALSEAVPLGSKHGWKSAFPIVQWSGRL